MPILLDEDLNYPLPKMYKVRQSFAGNHLSDVGEAVRREMRKPEIAGRILPGSRVALAVGSRGIQNLALIIRTVLDCIKELGGQPFIISAMGSHGGGTPEGQREILYSYGITEDSMGVPVVTDVEVEYLEKTAGGAEVYFDKSALAADLIVPVNRIKLHTDFTADIQSGLCKMLVIGLGNHKGCSSIHEQSPDAFGKTIEDAAGLILQKTKVGFGIGIVENAYDQTMLIEAIPAQRYISREKELLKTARDNMPRLIIPDIDVLIVEEIGKNISGAGYDPNILGKSFVLKEFVLPVPSIKRMVLLDVSEESHGNAIGMGAFDVITRKLFDKLDLASTYANAVASQCPEDARIPIIANTEEEALRIAVKLARVNDTDNLKLVKIKDTLHLEVIEVSRPLLRYVNTNPRLTLLDGSGASAFL